jgi:hypothetical protein
MVVAAQPYFPALGKSASFFELADFRSWQILL